MNLRQLEYFVAVAENCSFTKTAEQFFISQTAVTQQIKSLEEQLNVTLFKRNKRHVELTPAGSVFLVDAKAILSRMGNAVEHVQKAATGLTGTLRLGIISGYDLPRLPEILRTFRSTYPNVFLSLEENSAEYLYEKLKSQELDVAINAVFSSIALGKHKICQKTIQSYPLMVLLPASHPLSFRSHIALEDLKNDSFIFTATGKQSEQFGQFESTMAHFQRAGFTPNIIQTMGNFSLTALMVASGLGIAIVPAYALSSCRSLIGIVAIPVEPDLETVNISLTYSEENHNPTIDKFLSLF